MKQCKRLYFRRVFALVATSGMLVLSSCASEGGIFDPQVYDHIDREQELSRDDYEHMSRPKGDKKGITTDKEKQNTRDRIPAVPQIAQILAAPRPPKIGKSKLVSLTVTDDVPLKDVLIELARLADVDIELGTGIRGGISFRAKDKPFNEVIERIADLAGLRYNIKNGVLRVERDMPYVKNYPIDFLNVTRNSQSQVSLATDVLSAGGESGGGGGGESGGGGSSGGGGGGFTSGTTTSINSDTVSDLWASLEASMTQILNYSPGTELQPLAGEEPENEMAQGAAAGSAGASGGGEGGEGGASAGGGGGTGIHGAFYVINRQAGVVSVSASQRQHEMVEEYLKLLERSASAQVLIEAKIVEVELDKNFQSGVDWSAALGNTDLDINLAATDITNGANVAVLGPDNNLGISLESVVQLTERFGTSRTLSSPRLHAINNQQAILTFAENRIFFEVQQEVTPSVDTGNGISPPTITYTTSRRSVPIGIILSILPSVNMDKAEVTLNVRPTLSRQIDSVIDPGSALINAGLPADQQFTNEVPVVEVRELDSVMKLKSGGVMIIGGLMEESSNNTDEGVPGFSSIPWLGNAFKRTNKTGVKRELIIFIKASIVNSSGSSHPADERVYEKFSDDPRPLTF